MNYNDLSNNGLYEWLKKNYLTELEKDMAAVYFNINVKNYKKALLKYLNDINNNLLNVDNINYTKLLLNSKNYIHSSPDNNSFIMFDIDTKDEQMIKTFKNMFKKFIQGYSFCIETKNGYHLIFDKRNLKKLTYDIYKLNFDFTYKEINRKGERMTKTYISISKESSVVIPGTYQRNFKTRLIDFWNI